jgi:sulfonate transport system substrate-binding protein
MPSPFSICRGRVATSAFAALAGLTAAVVPACAGAGAATPSYTLRVGVINNLTGVVNGLEGWGTKKGIWLKQLRAQGVTAIDWQTFPNGPNLDAALAGGSLDIGILGDTPALTAKSQAAATTLINQDTTGLDTWIFAKKNGPKSVAALSGKTVAVPEGSYIYRALIGILSKHHLLGKVNVTNLVSVPEGVAALRNGSIDAFAEQPSLPLVDGGFPVIAKASQGYPDLLGTSVTVISSAALKAHPSLPAAWNKARTAVVASADGNQAAYYQWDTGPTGNTVSLLKQVSSVNGYHPAPFTTSGSNLLKAADAFLFDQKIITKPVNIMTWKLSS